MICVLKILELLIIMYFSVLEGVVKNLLFDKRYIQNQKGYVDRFEVGYDGFG